jgi:hypothetical protein
VCPIQLAFSLVAAAKAIAAAKPTIIDATTNATVNNTAIRFFMRPFR